jgi:hypothetical protein
MVIESCRTSIRIEEQAKRQQQPSKEKNRRRLMVIESCRTSIRIEEQVNVSNNPTRRDAKINKNKQKPP